MAAPRAPLLDVHDIASHYRESGAILQALDDVSLSIRPGEFVTLIGPSGCGKSTLLDIIAGLQQQTTGTVALDGGVLTAPRRLGATSYMRQRDLLMPWRTALDNAALALEVHGTPRAQARNTAARRFADFGLTGFEDAWPSQLSGGMRQRVAFLRTMLAERPLLLLDEPFGALDALNRLVMQSWLLDVWERERRAVLLVTHDIDEAIFLADRVLVMSQRPGTIIRDLPIDLPRPRSRSMLTSQTFMSDRTTLMRDLGMLEPSGAPR